jgi:hypothetical protein
MTRVTFPALELALILTAGPAMAGGVVDSPLPAPFTKHVFTVPGIPRISNLEAFFSCTNLDDAPVTIGVELYSAAPNLLNDAAATSITVGSGATVVFGTSSAVNQSVDAVIGSASSRFSARILATSTKIGCNSFLSEVASGTPTSGWPLTIIKGTKQKAAN